LRRCKAELAARDVQPSQWQQRMQSARAVAKMLGKRVCLLQDRQCRFRLLLQTQTIAPKHQEPIFFGGKLNVFDIGCTQCGASGGVLRSLEQRVCPDEMLGKGCSSIAMRTDGMKSGNCFLNVGLPMHVCVNHALNFKHWNIGREPFIGLIYRFNSAQRPLRVGPVKDFDSVWDRLRYARCERCSNGQQSYGRN